MYCVCALCSVHISHLYLLMPILLLLLLRLQHKNLIEFHRSAVSPCDCDDGSGNNYIQNQHSIILNFNPFRISTVHAHPPLSSFRLVLCACRYLMLNLSNFSAFFLVKYTSIINSIMCHFRCPPNPPSQIVFLLH